MAAIDRVTKEQTPIGMRRCATCQGTRKVVVKSDSGEKKTLDCPVCGGSGRNGLVTK